MALIRAALTKVLPDEDLVLSLDVDTIIDKNIDDLWDYDMSNYYIAGVVEPHRSLSAYKYFNFGVCLLNLKLLRETKFDDRIIWDLNNNYYRNDVQDCFSRKTPEDYKLKLPSDYNAGHRFCLATKNKKIIHYASNKNWFNEPEVLKYQRIPLSQVTSIW